MASEKLGIEWALETISASTTTTQVIAIVVVLAFVLPLIRAAIKDWHHHEEHEEPAIEAVFRIDPHWITTTLLNIDLKMDNHTRMLERMEGKIEALRDLPDKIKPVMDRLDAIARLLRSRSTRKPK